MELFREGCKNHNVIHENPLRGTCSGTTGSTVLLVLVLSSGVKLKSLLRVLGFSKRLRTMKRTKKLLGEPVLVLVLSSGVKIKSLLRVLGFSKRLRTMKRTKKS